MSHSTVTLYLPCDVVRFRAVTDFGTGLSLIGETVLQALAAQPMPLPALATLLALPRQVVADAVHALWRQRHVVFDLGSDELRVGLQARKAVAAHDLTSLSGSEREERTVELIVDPILGQVLPHQHRRHAPREQRVDPPKEGSELAEIPPADLHRAAIRALRARPGPNWERDRRIVDLRPLWGAPHTRRWRPVLVNAWLEEASETLRITVVDSHVPRVLREAGSARLTALAADRPAADFVRLLRSHATVRSPAPSIVTPEALADLLVERSARLAFLAASQRDAYHRRLSGIASDLHVALEARSAAAARVRMLGKGEGEAVRVATGMVDRSTTQVVIVASRLGKAALRTLVPRLQAARERGVQVVVLLHDQQPPVELMDVAHHHVPAPMVLLPRCGRAQAGLVVSDDTAALVLGATALDEHGAIGVELRNPHGGVCAPVRSLLGWVRSVTPDRAARIILTRPSDGAPGIARPEEAEPGPLPEPPPFDGERGPAVAAWEEAWRVYAAGQRSIAGIRPLPEAGCVTGVEDLQALWQALRTANRRLVVASPRVSDRMVDARFLTTLRGRLAHGVMVTLAYQSGEGNDPAALSALDALAAEFPYGLFLVEAPAGARALVWDDEAVLSADDRLSGDLLDAERSAAGHARLGLRLSGTEIADRIAAAAGEPPPVTAQVSTRRASRADDREPLKQIVVFTTVQRMHNLWHRDGSVRRALEALAAVDDPWPVLDRLVLDTTSGSGDALARAAAAWCLTHRAPTTGQGVRWQEWLVRHHWCTGRFAEAALLLTGAPAITAPRLELALVAAALGTDVSGMALLTAMEDTDRSAAEDACLLAAAAAETLRTAADDYAGIVASLLAGVAAPWRSLGEAVLDYHEQARGIPPGPLLRPMADEAAQSRHLAAAWAELSLAVERARQMQTRVSSLRRVQLAMFKQAEPLGRLESAVARHDAEAVRAFLRSSANGEPQDATVNRFIDDLWARMEGGAPELLGSQRRTFTSRIAAIFSASAAVADADADADRLTDRAAGEQVAAPVHLAAARSLVERVGALSPTLSAEAETLSYPETDLAVHVLRRILHMIAPEAL